MALIPASVSLKAENGKTTMRPANAIYLTVPGDAAYTAAAGSEIEVFLRSAIGHSVIVGMVDGYAVLTAAPTTITHLVRYNPATKAIFLNTLTTGVAQADANLSTSTLHLCIFGG